MSGSDWVVLAALQCPAGGLCDCKHPGGEWACSHCRCDCSWPDQFETDYDPDACVCCHRMP